MGRLMGLLLGLGGMLGLGWFECGDELSEDVELGA